MLFFGVEDDARFMQRINNLLTAEIFDGRKVKVNNFATCRSAMAATDQNPDIVFLNYFINKDIKGALKGVCFCSATYRS